MSESWLVDGPKVIEVGSADAPVRRVKIVLVGGRVDVVAHDDPEGQLEIQQVNGRALEVSWDGETLEVRHPQARWEGLLGSLADRMRGDRTSFDDSAEMSLAVPRDVALQIGTVSADGLAVGLSGPVELRSVTSTITLDRITGPVVAHTVSGSIEARGQTGDMRMDSVSGSFTVQSDGAPSLAAKTVSGTLVVDAGVGPLVVAFSSVSGGLVLRSADHTTYDADLRSVTGNVIVGGRRIKGDFGAVKHRQADKGAAVRVKANTVSGDITLLAPDASTSTSSTTASL
jgi:hypothetical protein